MERQNKKTKKGQILLITLLVLTILGIITVSLVTLANRDIGQVSSTDKYEQAYNTAENELFPILNKYSQYGLPLTTLPTDFTSCNTLGLPNQYECQFVSSNFSNISFNTTVTVKEMQDVIDFQLYKDRTFDIDLNSVFKGELSFTWDKAAAIDFALTYKDVSTNTLKVIRDVYDLSSPVVISSLSGDDPYNDPLNIHPFVFAIADITNLAKSTKFTISQINGLPASAQPISLRVTPRMTEQLGAINLTITATDKTQFPNQLREFVSTSYIAIDKNTPVASLKTQIPLYPQVDNAFDYALIAEGALSPSPSSSTAPTPIATNVAVGKAATESSNYTGAYPASRAVDGNSNPADFSTFNHTNADPNAWWQLDLGSPHQINTINVHNTNNVPTRLQNFYVFVSDSPFSSTNLATTLAQPGVSSYYMAGQAGFPSIFTINRSGRYIRVQFNKTDYLHMSELEVIGYPF